MNTARRSIKDYFSPSGNKRKRDEIHSSSNKKCNAEKTNANKNDMHSSVEEVVATEEEVAVTESSLSSGKKIRTIDMPTLKGNEENSFPVSLSDFIKYTNVTDLIITDIKDAKPHSYEQYISDKKYIADMIHKFYAIFYAKPKYRNSRPISHIKLLKECPEAVAQRIFNIPEAFQKKKRKKHKNKEKKENKNNLKTIAEMENNQNHSEDLISPKPGSSKSQGKARQTVAISYPVSIKEFTKFVNFDEDFEHYLHKLCKGDAKKIEKYRQMKDMRLEYDNTFYKKFYAMPCVRHKLKWKFKACPQTMRDKILLRASCEEMTEAYDKSNENASKSIETNNNFIGDATKGDNNEGNQFVSMVNIPILKGKKEDLFPIGFSEFQKYTNVIDLIIADIKEKKPKTHEQCISNTEYVSDLAYKFYKTFYAKPNYRNAIPLRDLKLLKSCPKEYEKRIFHIPEAFQEKKYIEKEDDVNNLKATDGAKEKIQKNSLDSSNPKPDTSNSSTLTQYGSSNDTNQQESTISYPVSLKEFKKYVNFDEDYEQYLFNLCKRDSTKIELFRQMKNTRLKYDSIFYNKFYAIPSMRHKLKWKFRPCPQTIRDRILASAKKSEDNSSEIADRTNVSNDATNKDDNEENQFANIINLPDLDTEKIKQFPVKFCTFLEKTNVLDVIDDEIVVNRRGDMQYIKQVAHKFFIAFYTKPELRNSKPLKEIKCPQNLENQFFQIPQKNKINMLPKDKNNEPEQLDVEPESQNSKETEENNAVSVNQKDKVLSVNDDVCLEKVSIPVDTSPPPNNDHFKKFFKKFVCYDNIIDEIFKEAVKNNSEKFEKLRKDSVLRSRALRNYYEAFYKRPEIRQRYKFKMKDCPASIEKLILQIPETDCFSDEGDSIQQHKRSVAELDNHPEEMPQLKKQRILEAEEKVDSFKANVIQSLPPINEVQQRNQQNTFASPMNLKSSLDDVQHDKVKNILFNDFATKLSEDFFKKYLAGKLLNCGTENMQSQLLQRIKDKVLNSFTTKLLPQNKVHIQSVEVIKPRDKRQYIYKRCSLTYAARLSEGLQQRILFSILNMSFVEFQKYTRIHNAEKHFNTNEEILKLYNIAIKVEQSWHPSLYMSLLDLQEYLLSKDVVISDADFKHISPILLCCEEIALITNFDEIVHLDYFKETGKKLEDDESLLNSRRVHFFNKCKCHNKWIWQAPALVANWKAILQHNTAVHVPKLIMTPRTLTSTHGEECMEEMSAEDKNSNKVQHIQNLSENLEHFAYFQENPYENDDIETVVYPLHNKSFIVKDQFASHSDQLPSLRSEIFTLTEKVQSTEDVETVIFPIKQKLSLMKELIKKPERYLDNIGDKDNIDRNVTNVFRCEATLSMEHCQNFDTANLAPELICESETHPVTNEKSAQNILVLSDSDGKQGISDTVNSGQKLITANEHNLPTAKNTSQDIFLPSSNESYTNTDVRVSQDVLLSSASTEMDSSPSGVDLIYSHLVKTPTKFTSTQGNKIQQKSISSSSIKLQFHASNTTPKTALPLSPNLFVSSSGSTNSQHHSQTLLRHSSQLSCLNELNTQPILEANSTQNNADEFFINMPNTQTQILSLPSDENLNIDPLDEIEQQMNDLFGEDATTTVLNQCAFSPDQSTQDMVNILKSQVNEGTSNEPNSTARVETKAKTITLQPVMAYNITAEVRSHEDIILQSLDEPAVNQITENLTGSSKQSVINTDADKNTEAMEENADVERTRYLPPETSSDNVISSARSVQPKETNSSQGVGETNCLIGDSHIPGTKQPEIEGNVESSINSPPETDSVIVMPNERSVQSNETNSSQAAKESQRTTCTKDDKIFKKETGLPNQLQFTLNNSDSLMIIETIEQSPITISDDDDDDKNVAESQPQIIYGPIKQEVKFLNNLQFTIDDSGSAPEICSLETTPLIVLDDDDCNTALVDQLMNPIDESSTRGVEISKICSTINDDETGTFCEAQKIPSSIEENDTTLENLQELHSNPTLITESDNNNQFVQNPENIASVSDQDNQQNVELFVEMADNSGSAKSSEELIFECIIDAPSDIDTVENEELPEQEPISQDNEQQLNVDSTMAAAPQVSDDTGATAEMNSDMQNVNVNPVVMKNKKTTVPKRKQSKNNDIIPQILHTFRPLEVAAVTKTYEKKRRSKSPKGSQQEKTLAPAEIINSDSTSGNNSSGATKSFSASQALATDCTLFNNTELLRDLEQIQNKPEAITSVNVQRTSSTCSLSSTISTSSVATCASVSEQGKNNF